MLIYFARDIARLTLAWIRGLADRQARARPRLPTGLAGDPRDAADRRARVRVRGSDPDRGAQPVVDRDDAGGVRRAARARRAGGPPEGRPRADDRRAGPHSRSCAGDGAGAGRVPLGRDHHRGALPRAHASCGSAVLVPARDPGRRGVRDLPAAGCLRRDGPSGLQLVVATADRFRRRLRGDRLAAALRRASQRLRVRLVPVRAGRACCSSRSARGGSRRPDRAEHAFHVRLADRDHPDPAAPRAVVGERGRRAGGPHPRRRAGRDRAVRRPCGWSTGSPGFRSPRSSARRRCAASRPSRRCSPSAGSTAVTEPGLAEVDYGSWTGRRS